MKSYFVRKLNEHDRVPLFELRKSCYLNTFTKIKDEKYFSWSLSDQQSIVFGLFHLDRLVSTIRYQKLSNPVHFSTNLEFTVEQAMLILPVAVTSRACTQEQYRNRGAHSFLKSICLRRAISDKIEFCVATLMKRSPRLAGLERLGYSFLESDRGWKGFLWDESPPVLTVLNLQEKGAAALKLLDQNSFSLRNQIIWESEMAKDSQHGIDRE